MKFEAQKILILIIIGVLFGNILSLNISGIEDYTEYSEEKISCMKLYLNFSTPIINNYKNFVTLQMNETNSYDIKEGLPVLPIYKCVKTFPLGTRIVDVEYDCELYGKVSINKKIIAASGLFKKNNYFLSSKNIYQNITKYPDDLLKYNMGGGLNGSEHVTFLNLFFFPIYYEPNKDMVTYAKKVIIEIKYVKSEIEIEHNICNNFDDEEKYNLIIICDSYFEKSLQPLIDHKDNIGIKSKITTLQNITGKGRDKPEQIKYYIKEIIENNGVNYVVLIGNEKKMPVRYSYDSNFSGVPEPFISDLYYSDIYDAEGSFCDWDTNNNNRFAETMFDRDSLSTVILDKVDLYPDIHLGRIPCKNITELEAVINKIIDYETIEEKSWFNNLILFGGNGFPAYYDLIMKFLNLTYDGYKSNIAWEGENLCNKVETVMNDFTAKKFYASSLIFPYFNNIRNVEKPSIENINKAINEGAGFILISAHGTPERFETNPPIFNNIPIPFPSGYKISQLKDLDNKQKLPIMIFEACSIGDFSELTGLESPMGWEFLKIENGGSIATFCYTHSVWVSPGSTYSETKGGYLSYLLFKSYANGLSNAGDMLTKAITDYLNDDYAMWEAHGDSYIHFGVIQMLSLFGDPTLIIGD